MKKLSQFISILLCLFSVSCTLLNQVAPSSITVNLPGSETRAPIIPENLFGYEITVTCPSVNYSQTLPVSPEKNSAEFKDLLAGTYTVTVRALTEDLKILGSGSKSVEVSGGTNARADIVLGKPTLYLTANGDRAVSTDNPKAGYYPEYPLLASNEEVLNFILSGGYTVSVSDITSSSDYASISGILSNADFSFKNIILNATGENTTLAGWQWEDSEISYGLTLGSGIQGCAGGGDNNFGKIVSLTLGDDFEVLSGYVWEDCDYLTEIKLGKNVRCISSGSSLPASLTTIEFPKTTEVWYVDTEGHVELANESHLAVSSIKAMSTTVSLVRAPAPVAIGAPYGVWSGNQSDTYYKNFRASDSVGKYADSIGVEGDLLDFTFDANGNLYALIYNDTSYIVKKYAYTNHSFGEGTTTLNNSSSQTLSLYTDMNNNRIYIKQGNGNIRYFDASANPAEISTINNASTISKEFAVSKNGYVYTFGISDSQITLAGKITDGSFESSSGSTVIFGDHNVTGIAETENMKLTDLQIIGDYLYVLVRQVGDYFYSRGAVVRLIINEDGSLTFKDKLGWYNKNKALDCSADGITADNFLKNYFAGPTKFVAIMPKKLVIADDGGYFYMNGTTGKSGNINRIVTVNLDRFAIESSYDVNSKFDKEVNSESQFGSIKFENAN